MIEFSRLLGGGGGGLRWCLCRGWVGRNTYLPYASCYCLLLPAGGLEQGAWEMGSVQW